MFGRIAAFEFRYQVRQPVFWVAAAFFFLIVFGYRLRRLLGIFAVQLMVAGALC